MEEQRDLEEELGWNEIGATIIGAVTGASSQNIYYSPRKMVMGIGMERNRWP